ncbi:MAG: serine--tRNA ligase, partial [Solirubrobacterales bacterium]
MLDLRELRRDPDSARQALARRDAAGDFDLALELDGRRRELIPELEALRAEQNEANDAIAAARRDGGDADAQVAAMKEVSEKAKAIQDELAGVEAELQAVVDKLPNLPEAGAPDEDTVIREAGERPAIESPRDHLELAGDRVDMERGARLSGSRFAYLRGELVLLELALVRWVLDLLGEHGFEPVIPPVLVREEALYGTGFLP